MEFEKNKPTTARDLALAAAPRVTLQPFHQDIQAEPVTSSYQAEGSFKLEAETTDAAPPTRPSRRSTNHAVAVALSLLITGLFALGLCWLFLQR